MASPAEAAFGETGIAVTEGQASLGLEESALMAAEALSSQVKQLVVGVLGVVHERLLRDEQQSKEGQRVLSHRSGEGRRRFGEIFNCQSPWRWLCRVACRVRVW